MTTMTDDRTDDRRVTKFAYNLWRLGDLLTAFDRILSFPVNEDDSEEAVLTKNTETAELDVDEAADMTGV